MKKAAFCRATLLALLTSFAAGIATAQDHEHQGSTGGGTSHTSTQQGYTAAERAEGLRSGRGMGLAMAAESNGYPGPRHVLELADAIELTAEQREKTQLLFDRMQSRASKLGEKLLREEAALNALFAERRATRADLVRLVNAAAQSEAELKITHLETHLAMMAMLTPAQIVKYVELRRAGAGSGRTRPTANRR